MRPFTPRRVALLSGAALSLSLAACSGSPAPVSSTSLGTGTPNTSATTGTAPVPTEPPTTSVPTGPTDSTGTSGTGTPPAPTTSSVPADPDAACAATYVSKLSAQEKAGQLLMVGLDTNAGRSSLDRLVTSRHLGGVILLGGWYDGAASVRQTTSHLAGLAGTDTGNLRLFLAADQEGGQVQQLRGSGFTRMPSAREENSNSPERLTSVSAQWAKELKAVGINVNLAPVADTVPKEIGTRNQPIGRWGREFSNDPARNAVMVPAFVKGTQGVGVSATVKHFPGLGRITGNTDLTATGIDDDVATTKDPYLQPFAAGIAADTDFVMVGSAIYPKIDGTTNAMFSTKIVTDLLRGQLGYQGVVITDDVGVAKSVSRFTPAERAVKFVSAGGDIVLTARPSDIAPMHNALTKQMAEDPAFAKQVDASVTRVVALKAKRGLATCG